MSFLLRLDDLGLISGIGLSQASDDETCADDGKIEALTPRLVALRNKSQIFLLQVLGV